MQLLRAVRKGDVAAIDRCLTSGAPVDQVDAAGWTPLFIASFNGHDRIVEKLITAGAQINYTDSNGWTALMIASMHGHATVVDTLLAAGAKLHVVTKQGNSAMILASTHHHTGVVQRLVAAGATLRPHSNATPPATAAHEATKMKTKTKTKTSDDAWSCATAATSGLSSGEDLRTASVRLMDEPSAFPCHLAVLSSKGDLAQFCDAASVSEDGANANANMKMKIDVLDTTTSRQKICAAEYAYLLGYDGIGDVLLSRMDNPSLVVQRTPALSAQLIENATDTNEYICVIHETDGDVVQCQRYLCAVDDTSHSLDARFEVEVVRQRREPMVWSAVELASHLGYDAVVEYLIKKTCRHLPIKERFALVDRTAEQAAKWAAVELGKK